MLPPPPPRREARNELKPPAAFRIPASTVQLRHLRAAAIGHLHTDKAVPGRQAGTRDRHGPSVAVRGKPTVHTDRPSGRTPSAYLHRRGVCKWLRDGPFTVLGRASLCSLALIAAGSCERPAGSGGAKRPRSGAAGALDAAGRERIMAGGG